MMMTSGEGMKYKSTMDAFRQIIAQEGVKALFRGTFAKVLLGIAGAGVLAGYDQLQLIFMKNAYGSSAIH
jgi:solute carrier family 25 (adenine nucleotide translocator) protein 4/5/6/31